MDLVRSALAMLLFAAAAFFIGATHAKVGTIMPGGWKDTAHIIMMRVTDN